VGPYQRLPAPEPQAARASGLSWLGDITIQVTGKAEDAVMTSDVVTDKIGTAGRPAVWRPS
jgi:hypothetical protein